jgi:hypothetical protein
VEKLEGGIEHLAELKEAGERNGRNGRLLGDHTLGQRKTGLDKRGN